MNRIFVIGGTLRAFNLFRKDLLKDLLAKGVAISCIYWDNLESDRIQLEHENLRWHSLRGNHISPNLLSDLLPSLRLAGLFLKEKPDAMLSFNAKPIFFSSIIARLTRHHIHSIALMEGLGKGFHFLASGRPYHFRRLVFRIFTLFFDRWYFLNKRDEEAVGHVHGSRLHSTVLSGIGVNIGYFVPPETPYQLYSNRKIIFVGRTVKEKGIEEFIEIARKVKKADPSWSFEIAGLPVSKDGIGKKRIDKWLQEGIIERCELVSDMRAFYQSASLLMLPSSYNEGLPTTVMEAQAMGLPCLVADKSYLDKSILDKKTGFLIDPLATDKWVEKIQELSDYKIYQEFSLSSRKYAEQTFDHNIANKILIEGILRR